MLFNQPIKKNDTFEYELECALENVNSADAYLDRQTVLYGLDVVEEGVGSALKKFFNAVMKILVKIWKSIVKAVKWVIKKIKDLFSTAIDKIKGTSSSIREPIDLPAIIVTKDSATVEHNRVKDDKSMQAVCSRAINHISKTIQERSKEEIELVKQYQSMDLGNVNESADESSRSLIEKVIYNYNPGEDYYDNTTYADNYRATDDYAYQREWIDENVPEKYREEEYDELEKTVDILYSKGGERFDNKQLHGVAYQGSNIMDHYYNKDLGLFDIEKAKAIAESPNIVEEYTKMIMFDLKTLYAKYPESQNLRTTMYEIGMLDNDLKDTGITAKDLMNNWEYAKDLMIYKDRPDLIRRFLKIRINWNRSIIKTLERILSWDHGVFSIGKTQLDLLRGQLNNSDYANALTKKMNNVLSNAVKQGIYVVDMRVFNLGIFLTNRYAAELALREQKMTSIIQYLVKYNIVIICHGDSTSEQGKWKLYGGLQLPDNTVVQTCAEMCDWCKANSDKFNIKRVLFLVCNGGNAKLPEWCYTDRKIIFRISTRYTTA